MNKPARYAYRFPTLDWEYSQNHFDRVKGVEVDVNTGTLGMTVVTTGDSFSAVIIESMLSRFVDAWEYEGSDGEWHVTAS